MATGSGELRSRLLAAKLTALVRDRWGEVPGSGATPLRGGAGLSAGAGADAWVLAESEPLGSLGPALAWALRREASRLHLLVERAPAASPEPTPEPASALARRLAAFALEGEVWRVEGRALEQVAPAVPEAEPLLPPEVGAFASRIRAAGATPVAEHGVLTGELLGLEVCRVVPDETGGWRLAVGVGRYDREVHDAFLAGDPGRADRSDGGNGGAGMDAVERALARVMAEVARHRRAGAGPHPANSLAPERWLRAVVVADPGLAGASLLVPSPSPVARADLRMAAPAPAVGLRPDGSPVLVVCSAGGIDLDLVPVAADARLAVDPAADLVIVVDPAADAPITRDLAALLRRPATVAVVAEDWRRLAG